MAKSTATKTGSVGAMNLASLMKPTGAMTEFMRNLGLEDDEGNKPSVSQIPPDESPAENSGHESESESAPVTESTLKRKVQVQSPEKAETRVVKSPTPDGKKSKELDVYANTYLTIPKKGMIGHRRYFVSKETHKILTLLKSHAELEGEVLTGQQIIDNILMNHFRANVGLIREAKKRVFDAQDQLDL